MKNSCLVTMFVHDKGSLVLFRHCWLVVIKFAMLIYETGD